MLLMLLSLELGKLIILLLPLLFAFLNVFQKLLEAVSLRIIMEVDWGRGERQ